MQRHAQLLSAFRQRVFGQAQAFSDDQLTAAGELAVDEAFGVYRNGYIARLTESLGETFEANWRVLGDELFFETAERFIQQHPATGYNLNDYGHLWTHWIADQDDIVRPFPFLPDLARFELAFKSIFHQAPFACSDSAQLQNPETLALVVCHKGSAVELFSAPYPVYDIWKRRHDDDFDGSGIDFSRSTHLVILKNDQRQGIHVFEMSEGAFQVLESWLDQQTLSEAFDVLETQGKEIAEECVAEAVGLAVSVGVFEHVR